MNAETLDCRPLDSALLAAPPFHRPQPVAFAVSQATPQRHPPPQWLAAMLDAVDVGLILVHVNGDVAYANHAAEAAMAASPDLWSGGIPMGWRLASSRGRLPDAVRAASLEGKRRLVIDSAGQEAARAVAVLPFEPAPQLVMLVIGRQQMCEPLALHFFAMAHGLTGAEQRVLHHLTEGLKPSEIASRQGVMLSTVRTQVSAIRAKASAASIGALVRQVTTLPPIACALRRRPPAEGTGVVSR